MGIVNVSPDSFSGDGATDTAAALARAHEQREAGCDIIDIGGESTRPGYDPIDAATEVGRLVPVIEALRVTDRQSIVSVDTFKADVYRRAHAAGGDLLNSIWGASDALIEVCVETRSPDRGDAQQGGSDLRTRRRRRSARVAGRVRGALRARPAFRPNT